MYPYLNEDAAWQRLQDIQREMENRRLMAAGRPYGTFETLRRLAARAWLLGGLAARRTEPIQRDGEGRSDLA